MRFQFSGPPQKRGFGCTCILGLPRPEWPRQPEACAPSPRIRRAFSIRGERPGQPEACVPSPRVLRTFSLRGPSARHRSGLRKSIDRNRGPVCWVGGGGFSGAELAPFPSPLPPSSSGDGLFSGVSQSLCFANRQRCVPAGCSLLLRKTVTCGAQLEIRRLRYVSRMGFVKKLKQGKNKREKYNIIRHILHKNNSDPEKTFHLNINTF